MIKKIIFNTEYPSGIYSGFIKSEVCQLDPDTQFAKGVKSLSDLPEDLTDLLFQYDSGKEKVVIINFIDLTGSIHYSEKMKKEINHYNTTTKLPLEVTSSLRNHFKGVPEKLHSFTEVFILYPDDFKEKGYYQYHSKCLIVQDFNKYYNYIKNKSKIKKGFNLNLNIKTLGVSQNYYMTLGDNRFTIPSSVSKVPEATLKVTFGDNVIREIKMDLNKLNHIGVLETPHSDKELELEIKKEELSLKEKELNFKIQESTDKLDLNYAQHKDNTHLSLLKAIFTSKGELLKEDRSENSDERLIKNRVIMYSALGKILS